MSQTTHRYLRTLLLSCVVFSLMACSSDTASKDKEKAPAGKRISVLEASRRSLADQTISDYQISLPEQAVIPDWAQPGGNTEHAPGHFALGSIPKQIWSRSIGDGSGGYYKLLSGPVISEGVVYVMDARGYVSAYDAKDGDRIWRAETTPAGKSDEAIGAGVTVQGKVLYAATGFGEVIAMSTKDGAVLWRHTIGKPLRSPPTVAEGRVFVINIENETFALDAETGLLMWRYSGIAENATLMGASSPAVHGNTVVVAFSSGELFGLRAQNGRVVWSEVLAVPTQIGALPAIADIRGLPVIEGGRVFSVSHSGRMASLDERTGERAWENDIGGVNTPYVSGNALFMVTLDNELAALAKGSGKVVWSTQLQKLEDPEDRDSDKVFWWGPVLAGGRLWLTNSLGHLVGVSPENGKVVYDREVGKSFFLPPVVANNTLFLLSDKGELIALQ